MASALEVKKLVAGYGRLAVTHDLDLYVDEGEVVALLGPNGAGKTTSLLTISGLLKPIGGKIVVLGKGVETFRRPEAIARFGVAHVPEDRALFRNLSVRENLLLASHGRARRRAEMGEALKYFPELVPLMARKVGRLSGGEQQMLALARAIMSRPRLMLIDEMSLGLAPVVVSRILPRLKAIAEAGCGVLMVEQHVQQALAIADRGYVLVHGEVAASGNATSLREDRAVIQSSYLGNRNLESHSELGGGTTEGLTETLSPPDSEGRPR